MRNLMMSVNGEPVRARRGRVGNPRLRILWRHLLPNCLTPVIVVATLPVRWAILEAAGSLFIVWACECRRPSGA